MIDTVLHVVFVAILVGFFAWFALAAFLMAQAEKESVYDDVAERQRARAHEGLARHELYRIPPADRQVETTNWRRSA